MSVNFFEARCKNTTNESLFGLCDNEDSSPAYIDLSDRTKWNATVNNSIPPKELAVVAIDNCIEMVRKNGEMASSCDCLLVYPDNIIFVELKNKRSNWIGEGMDQIEATIEIFNDNHDLSRYKHKRAFVSNKKHPYFHVVDAEKKRKFWDKYRVRLNVDGVINIK